MFGNTYDVTEVNFGHAKKVWREIRHRFPAGGIVSNVADWTSKGIIPSGTPVKWDAENKTIECFTDEDVTGAADLTALGINGFLQEDIKVTSENTVASGTAVYAGELYEYAFDSAVATKLKTLTTVPQVVFVL